MTNHCTPLQLVKVIDDMLPGFSEYFYTKRTADETVNISNCGIFLDLVLYIATLHEKGYTNFTILFRFIEETIVYDDELSDDAKLCFLDGLYNIVSNTREGMSAILSESGPATFEYLIDYEKVYIKEEYQFLKNIKKNKR